MASQRRPALKYEAEDESVESSTALVHGAQGENNDDTKKAVIPFKRSPLPSATKFPLAVILSFVTASMGYSLLGELTKGELASVSRSQDTWEDVAALASWRVVMLAVGWFGNLDSLDIAMLDLLSHGPHLFLLSTFYPLSTTTALSALVIDVTSVAVPFLLLRPLSDIHSPAAVRSLPNRELLDAGLQLYPAALSTGIYTVVLTLSLRFLLPRVLAVYFEGLPTLMPAYNASYISVLPAAVLFGSAASTFIFAPFATTGRAREDEKNAAFDPVAASFGETVWWNVWGYTAKTKVVVRRTIIVAIVSAVNTYLTCSKMVYGVHSTGAAAYASVWAAAAVFVGVGLGFVGSV